MQSSGRPYSRKCKWRRPLQRKVILAKEPTFKTKVTSLLTAMVTAAAWHAPAQAQQMSSEEMMAYLVQSICLDEAGGPTMSLPIEASCIHSRLQRSDDIASYRKHDWPNSIDVPEMALGYQASDSVVQRRDSRTLVVQTFDFGTDGRVFGRFDGGLGDGGQVALLVGDAVSFPMTEDGGGGIQWFLGEACRISSRVDEKFRSWLVFRSDIKHAGWRGVVARLEIASSSESCPRRFNDAFTRYRLDDVEFPFRIVDAALAVDNIRRRLNVVVSEHYGGSEINSSDHLERFFLAQGLGLVRWERWANANIDRRRSVFKTEQMLAHTARCPKLADYDAPAENWRLVDCRMWTTLVRQYRPWSVDDYHWIALTQFGRPE